MEQRQNFCLYRSHVVVSGKSILEFLHLLLSVVPPLLHPTSKLVVNFHMHDTRISFIWRWSRIHLFRRKLCHAVSVKGRKTKVSVSGNFTDAQVQPWVDFSGNHKHTSEHRACCSLHVWGSWCFYLNFPVRFWFCHWSGYTAACFPTFISNLPAQSDGNKVQW